MADQGIIRSIGGFHAEVTVQEQHTDELTITTHPVERGAPITDHAFKNPALLTIKAGWSGAYVQGYINSAGNGAGNLNDLYAQLLVMQSSAELISVQTGKRYYDNMLVKHITEVTDAATENVLMITAQLQEIFLVDTMTTTMPGAADRATPQATAGVAETGTKALQEWT